MSGNAWLTTCDTCGESWWSEHEPTTCTCADGGQWMSDRAVRSPALAASVEEPQ